ncbi:MAG: SCP2 sterol-binding domain-containing protein [Dehalococcoidia bacterium]
MKQEGKIDTDELSFRQLLEGMTLVFNQAAAGNLDAVIQFDVSGQEPGVYQLIIKSGACTFRKGPTAHPSLIIHTPSEIWRRISKGEISGSDALLQELYTLEGDSTLLMRFSQIFKRPDNFSMRDTSEPPRQSLFSLFRKIPDEPVAVSPGCRPAGPVRLPGMVWNYIFFLPWWLFWITFSLPAVGHWLSTVISLTLVSITVLYRLIFNRPTWMELLSLAFFILTLIFISVSPRASILVWWPTIGLLLMVSLWLLSLTPLVKLPFCAEFSKWGFVPALWRTSMFIQPNMAITLAWAGQMLLAALSGIAGKMIPWLGTPFSIAGWIFILPAAIFTSRYTRGVTTRRFKDIDKTISNLRLVAYAGLVITVGLLAWILFFLRAPAS